MALVLGASTYSDIFFVAFKLPNLFRRIFAEGAFAQVFIPAFVSSKQKGVFAFAILVNFTIFLLLFLLIVISFPAFFTKLIAFGFSNETIELAKKYVAINFIYLPLIFIVTFFASLLQYKEHFLTTALSTALLNISLILALFFFKNSPKETILFALSWGVVIGGSLQVAIHIFIAKRYKILKLLVLGCKKFFKTNVSTKKFYKEFLPAIAGNSTPQIIAFWDTWLASFLFSGSISYLYYANRIFQLPLALFAIAASTAIFPTITKKIKGNRHKEALEELKKSFWFLAILLSVFAVGGIMLSKEVVWLLFERGEFDKNDTLNTSFVLSMYLIGLLPYGLNKIFSLWLYANHKQLRAAKIAYISLGVHICLSLLLITKLKAGGLALSASVAGFVQLYFTLREFSLKRFLDIILSKNLFLYIFIIITEIAILYKTKGFIDVFLR